MVVEVSQTQDMTDAVAIPAKPKPVASKVVTPTLPKKEPATIESTTKEAVEEAFDLLAPTQVDNKLANGHRAIVLMTLDIERSHINLKKRIKELEPEDRVHEAISYFSEVHDDYELAATYLERLAKHDPAHSKLDASARDLAKIVRKIAAVHEKAYAFRQDKYALHTRETVLEYVTALAPLIEQYKPAHEKFLLAFFEEERVMLEERFQKTRAATSPLIHHHHGLLLSLARAMESTERYNHTNKTKPYLRQLRAHMKALEEFNIHDYKSELSSQVRNNAHTTQQAVLRTSIEFANYQKALGKYGKASRHDLDAHSKLISAYIDLYRMYNFAMKKYTTRPKL